MNIVNVALEVEGHDKNGKDTIAKYIEQLGGYKYTINVRGILTQLVYNDKFSRGNKYTFTYKPLIILLYADEEDVEVRCRMNKEPKINSKKDTEVYDKYANYLEERGYATIWRYNTSEMTPYNIGRSIVHKLNNLSSDDFILPDEPSACVVSSLELYCEDDLKDEDVYYGPLESSSESDLDEPKYIVGGDLNSVIYYDRDTMEPIDKDSVPKNINNIKGEK